MSRRRIRPSIRLRLTLTYTGLFLVAGASLLVVNYVLVSRREHRSGTAVSIVCKQSPALGLSGNVGGAAVGFTGALKSEDNVPPGCTKVTGPPQQIPVPQDIATQPLDSAKQRLATLAQVAAQGQDHTLHSLEVESAIALGLMAVASLGLGWWIAGRALRPVHRITSTARRLSEETLHERIGLEGPEDELKELADTFDAMLGRLDRAFAGQRRFVANASHELRTPLATERVLIDEALANRRASPDELRSILVELRANNEQTERLIDALLVLARSEEGVERWLPVDLGAVAAAAVEQARTEAATVGVDIRADLAPATTMGDPLLLSRLVGNLVENAIRHNRSRDGWVEVEVCSAEGQSAEGPEPGEIRLRVTNSGRVLAPEHIPALFEPFRRDADRTGTGFGLGLSIVESVVRAHDGRVDTMVPAAGGLEVVIHLPAHRGVPVSSEAALAVT
jgi:signal transduction histidine kinase